MTAFFELLQIAGGQIEVMKVSDADPLLFLLPGASGGIRAYADLCVRLTEAGLPAIGLNPRSCGASTVSLQNLSFEDLAADVIGVIERFTAPPYLIAGHAGGNRIARVVSSIRPDLVR